MTEEKEQMIKQAFDKAFNKNFGEDKEIIIDGVNVAGCRLYDYGICDSEMAEDLNCDKNPDCYYKQLKRLEQENKELKERFNSLKEIPIYEQCKALQQENEELTRENKNRNDWITSLNKKCEELIKEKLNYRSALEDIREDIRSFYGCEDSSNDYKLVKMIDKINEVLTP